MEEEKKKKIKKRNPHAPAKALWGLMMMSDKSKNNLKSLH